MSKSLISVSRTSSKEISSKVEDTPTDIDHNKKASVRFYKFWHDQLRRGTRYTKWSATRKKLFLEERMEDFEKAKQLIESSPY